MPTDTKLTDERVVEILATRGMGWKLVQARIGGAAHPDMRHFWEDDDGCCRAAYNWNPLTDLNACHEVEERLTEEQRHEYLQALFRSTDKAIMTEWEYCHADARTKSYALAEVLQGRERC